MKNRLDLDFTIETAAERSEWLNHYIEGLGFALTPKELETCANYVLWGKDANGLNAKQTKEIQLETRYGTWDAKSVESLDALRESPTFNEASISTLTDVHYKIPKTTFSRSAARRNAPPAVVQALEYLWDTIDRLELELNYYELYHNKRTKPPRDTLLARFDESELAALRARGESLTQANYLKKRHQLVELRREQYSYKDLYSTPVQKSDFEFYQGPTSLNVVDALPVGLRHPDDPFDALLFPEGRYPVPSDFDEADLEYVYKVLWRTHDPIVFDFTRLEDVYNLLLLFDELSGETPDLESELSELLSTLHYYIGVANLTPIQSDILRLKIDHVKNVDIAAQVNALYHKSYNANYISTIFRQKIIPAINEAAYLHRQTLENIFYPENFQTCRQCGKTLLLHELNFVHKAKSKTGFTTRCKRCDHDQRARRNNKQ